MYCTCPTHDAGKCVARTHHMKLDKALEKYGFCHCDCHEDENGDPVTEQEWEKLQEVASIIQGTCSVPRVART